MRLYVAYQWLDGFWEKFQSTAWMGPQGTGILAFWQSALGTSSSGTPVVTYGWYRDFIAFLVASHAEVWFAKVIVFGELAVGLGVLLGAFVGIAATFGLTMNMAFMLAGSTSSNPVLAVLEILLILAWKNAGYLGIDRWLLPALGTPWTQASVHARASQAQPAPRHVTTV